MLSAGAAFVHLMEFYLEPPVYVSIRSEYTHCHAKGTWLLLRVYSRVNGSWQLPCGNTSMERVFGYAAYYADKFCS